MPDINLYISIEEGLDDEKRPIVAWTPRLTYDRVDATPVEDAIFDVIHDELEAALARMKKRLIGKEAVLMKNNGEGHSPMQASSSFGE